MCAHRHTSAPKFENYCRENDRSDIFGDRVMKDVDNKERGMLIVEASIIFPIVFIVIFLMIYAGNAYYQKCRIEAIVNEVAIEAAAYSADPLLQSVSNNGTIPNVNSSNVYPYRYFDPNGVNSIQSSMGSLVRSRINQLDSGLFMGMKPKNIQVSPEYKNGFIYSTYSVYVKYDIVLPIRMLWSDENIKMQFSTYIDMPVSDTSEFIRNVDMVEDYLERSEAFQKFKETVTKAIDSAKKWFK